MKKAFITGITGQDGSYLAELLLSKGYEVHGLIHNPSETKNVDSIKDKLTLHPGDITDGELLSKIIIEGQFDEVYNLAGMTNVPDSFADPILATKMTALPPLFILDAIVKGSKHTKLFQASSSEMFGNGTESPQRETSGFHPTNPYGIAKLFAHHICEVYRGKSVFAASGILYNHESPRRGEKFVTTKIVRTLAEIKMGKAEVLELGDIDAMRDWGFAGDYVLAMWEMLQVEKAESYIIASGATHSARDFVDASAKSLGIELTWSGKGVDQRGVDQNGVVRVKVNPEFFRPSELHIRQGDITKITNELGWKSKVLFEELVKMMTDAEMCKLQG